MLIDARVMYTPTKQTAAMIKFITTPAEMINIRLPTLLSCMTAGHPPLPRIVAFAKHLDVTAKRNQAILYVVSPRLKEQMPNAAGRSDAEGLDVTSHAWPREMAEFVDEDHHAEAERDDADRDYLLQRMSASRRK